MKDPGIIRNRLKISPPFKTRSVASVQKEFGTFDRYLWQFVKGKTIIHRVRSSKKLPSRRRSPTR